MSAKRSLTYSDAGVSIEAADRAKEQIKALARATFNERVLTEIGSFGGMFDARFAQMRAPVLVASADGVGTKLKIAFLTGVHNSVGRDLVNHCVNDILTQGARPLFFLDYIATGRLAPDVVAQIVEGIALGCRENGCALLGGETAEMPGFYSDGEYDLAGFIVGIVERDEIIDGRRITPGDVVLALPSTGLHTNGYSLARKILFEIAGWRHDSYLEELGMSVGEALLMPHASYLRPLEGLLAQRLVKGLAHITGGGLPGNVPRVLPAGTSVRIARGTWPVPAIFELVQRVGDVADDEMFRTFNMGVGMIVIAAAEDESKIGAHVEAHGQKCFTIGRVIEGERAVIIE
ncbi:MAG: phosphoribosylformylglycinamidine cyclo-ligase [Pyrinomonas sp.]|uniref:phosphoribosylformylglycinamidine cyclo-ligase n=1 Tax=Pyrinomonas sp. TaxID=2080306 RepID=UPI00332E6FBA